MAINYMWKNIKQFVSMHSIALGIVQKVIGPLLNHKYTQKRWNKIVFMCVGTLY